MNDPVLNLMPEVWRKFFSHMPEGEDLVLLVLKGHLLVEEELNKVIDISFKHPGYLKDGRFTFFQTYKLVKSVHFKSNRAWVWDAIEKLNEIRNRYAHNLEPIDIERRIEIFNKLVCDHINTKEATLSGRLRHSIAMILSLMYDLRCRGYAI